jgi:hypothetical protein
MDVMEPVFGNLTSNIRDEIQARTYRGDQAAKPGTIVNWSLGVSPELNTVLQDLATKLGVKPGEVIQRALLLLTVAVELEQRGYELGAITREEHPKVAATITGVLEGGVNATG